MPAQRHPRHRLTGRGRGRAALAAAFTSAGLTAAAVGTAALSLTSVGPMDMASPVMAGTPVVTTDAGDLDDAAVGGDRAATQVEVPISQVFAGTADLSAIPLQALTAYQRAAQVIDRADKQCHADWTVIAAVGQVVSQHGLVDGGHLTGGGVVKPSLVGDVVRSETGHRLKDTDAGKLDGDKLHDRAIGPMLLAPTTWSVVGVDADSDGRRNPQDIDDTSLAVAVLLCNGDLDLRHDDEARRAVARVNGDRAFVRAVLAAASEYAAQAAGSGTTTVVSGPYAAPEELPAVLPARASVPERTPSDAVTPATLDQNHVIHPGGGHHTDHPTDPTETDGSPTDDPTDKPTDDPTSESPTEEPTDCVTDEATDEATDGATVEPTDDATELSDDEVCETSDEPTDDPSATETPAP